MDRIGQLKIYFRQFLFTLGKHGEAVIFIYEHKLWRGVQRYGWVSKALVVLGVLVGLKMLQVLIDWWNGAAFQSSTAAMSSMGSLMESMAEEGYEFLFTGGMKYVLLILLEVVIFHFSRRTMAILGGNGGGTSFQEFVDAQIRMIKVVLRCWVLEVICTAILKLFFNIFGFIDFVQPLAIGLVHSYFVGFALFDNYSEQFKLEIKESIKLSRKYVGVAVASGAILQILMPIPILGPIGGPLVGAVAVTLVMYELSDLHLRPRHDETPEPAAESVG